MRPVKCVFVILVQYCLINRLSGLIYNQDDNFNPEQHKNYKLLPPKNSCGTNGEAIPQINSRIVGGYETKLGEIPWIVQYGGKVGGEFYSSAGGNLISKWYVLTAAHVYEAGKRWVRLGEWDTRGDPDSQGDLHAPPVQDIEIAEFISHKSFISNKTDIKNDIALLRLRKPANQNYFVQPVCLPYGAAMSKDFTNENTVTAGWGITYKDLEKPPILFALKMTIADGSKCTEAYSHINRNVNYNEGHICAGSTGGKIGNVCYGDSGGPLLWHGSFEQDNTVRTYLLGVTSQGPATCATEGFPGVFTRTNFFMEWILDNMRE